VPLPADGCRDRFRERAAWERTRRIAVPANLKAAADLARDNDGRRRDQQW